VLALQRRRVYFFGEFVVLCKELSGELSLSLSLCGSFCSALHTLILFNTISFLFYYLVGPKPLFYFNDDFHTITSNTNLLCAKDMIDGIAYQFWYQLGKICLNFLSFGRIF
jgi:hypothetical protein